MSFDRVLPRPAGLYEKPTARIHRVTSSLLEHKIMDDRHGSSTVTQPSLSNGEFRLSKSDSSCSAALSKMQINRDKMAHNHIPASFATATKQSSILTIEADDRSASSSPTKSEAIKEPATQFCLCQPDPKIPRPRNAFILYRQHYQAAVVAQHPGLANPEISKIIGEQWRALPSEIKEEWKSLAEAEKARHQQQYPDYRYQPRRFGRDGYSRAMSISGPTSTQLGSTVCSRCGGRLMNPPSSPNTPLTASGPTLSSRSSQSESTSSHNSSARKSSKSHGRGASSAQLQPDVGRRASRSIWKTSDPASADSKRRRLNGDGIRRASTSETEPYPSSSQKVYVSRPGVAYSRSHNGTLSDNKLDQRLEEERSYDPSLTLPPLKANGPPPRTQNDVEATVMTIPVLNKIKVLAKISPPLSDRQDSSPRGTVIAVDGQDPALVKIIVKQLGTLLTKDGNYAVRVFEGPELRRRQSTPNPGQMGDATVDYLNVISAWHRISDEIVQFISSKPQSSGTPSTSTSPRLSFPGSSSRRASASPMVSSPNGQINGLAPIPGSLQGGPHPIPVALVPRYQLTTADVFACSIPINDRYAPLDHWQWMASLWRACVGPDVTIHIRECDKEELDRYGSGNPVEIRLNEARTLIVRRTSDSAKDIEEKALRRLGFEVEDFLTR